jgi:D-alanyl-D-alanine carboxypeptidase
MRGEPRPEGRPHPRRQARDDIPLARRTARLPSPRPSAPVRWARRLLGVVLVGGGVTLLLLGPLRNLVAPPPVPGLDARLSADGRLLGHFPYPEAAAADLVSLGPDLLLRSEAAEAFRTMRRAAAADGVDLRLLSGFRSLDLQKRLFFDVMAERRQSSRDRARVSAPPGFSEHSTGYAVDLGDGRRPATNLSPSFDTTPAYRWLAANAARHHFLMSFPKDNAQGVSYEPWHWRYEGSTDALRLFEPAHRLASR